MHNLGSLNGTENNFAVKTPVKKKLKRDDIIDNRKKRNSGKQHIDHKNRVKPAKEFKFHTCKCPYDCKSILEPERIEIFENFWQSGNWLSQENFISATCKSVPVRRNFVGPDSSRNLTLQYTLKGKRVCREVYLCTLGLSKKRVHYCVKIKAKGSCLVSPDKRGKHSKTKWNTPTIRNHVKEFIKRFPKYRSHYSDSQKIYFHPDLNFTKIYDIYSKDASIPNEQKFKESSFRTEFKKYNLAIYMNKKDTCLSCDTFKIKIDSCSDDECKVTLCNERSKHHAEVRAVKTRKDWAKSDKSDEILKISFDMQKIMSFPHLRTSVTYYKRQLSFLNFSIYNFETENDVFHFWNECEGKKGSIEIASCLFDFLSNYDLTKIKKVFSMSDACGGQNRNRCIVAFMMTFVNNHEMVDEWEHCFFVSGHSFMANDSHFGMLEKAKNNCSHLFSPDDWIYMIPNINDKFSAVKMGGKFREFDLLLKRFTFRSKNVDGDSFNWMNLKSFTVRKNSTIMSYKTSHLPDAPIMEIDFGKRGSSNISLDVPSLGERAIPLSFDKYKDICSLLELIPPFYREAYKALPHKGKPNVGDEFEFLDDDE